MFVGELIKHPVKQASISQAIVAGAQPKSIMPLQFGLAVAVDNRLASKWLNILLSRLGFAVSYDEVGCNDIVFFIDLLIFSPIFNG